MKATLKHYQAIFNLFALGVIIFLGVDLFYMIISVQLRQVDTQKVVIHRTPGFRRDLSLPPGHYQTIIDRNIFGSLGRQAEEVKLEEKKEIDATLEPTSLKIALLGTVVGDRQSTLAVIKDKGKKRQELYREGDTIQGADIRKILRGKVILRIGGRDEILTIEEGAASGTEKKYPGSGPIDKRTRKGDTITVSRSALQKSLKDIHQLLSQARIRPYFRDGKADGLAISNIKPGSFFARLGLKNGDIVQGIDGRDIRSPDDVLEVYERLKSGSRAELQIKRSGERKIIDYEFR
jgi:general secretion pathway protein C